MKRALLTINVLFGAAVIIVSAFAGVFRTIRYWDRGGWARAETASTEAAEALMRICSFRFISLSLLFILLLLLRAEIFLCHTTCTIGEEALEFYGV